MTGTGSTNTIDQLLSHTDGPSKPIADRDLTRVRSSAYIVHGNFARLDEICDDISPESDYDDGESELLYARPNDEFE
ncbi:hypothetical protein [Haladaptatus caseinilyticus]|uniref:hypothetical protein n=1 Tax=Haladaptatus caseinilyticus TaxID=2993314 RepID=UPI00224B92D5|nr:hypothetical protein [Haladaptatus caseinilyticus]